MSFVEYCASGVLILLAVYLLIRISSAAFYQSKHDYERKRDHGSKQKPE